MQTTIVNNKESEQIIRGNGCICAFGNVYTYILTVELIELIYIIYTKQRKLSVNLL